MLAISLVHCHRIQTFLFYQRGILLLQHVLCHLAADPFCLVVEDGLLDGSCYCSLVDVCTCVCLFGYC
jgi:hypothetical protein